MKDEVFFCVARAQIALDRELARDDFFDGDLLVPARAAVARVAFRFCNVFAAAKRATGDGRGFTVNIPLEAGCTDADYSLVYRAIVCPVLDEFAPQLVLVSAGYDAHERDPLANMRMTAAGYREIVAGIAKSARRHGEIALTTEGGYDLHAIAECLQSTIAALEDSSATESAGAAVSVDRRQPTARRGERALESVRAALKPYWRAL